MLAGASETSTIFDSAELVRCPPYRWRHLQRSASTERLLLADPEIPEELAWALLERDTLPRAIHSGKAIGLFLRGINEARGAEPEDMISLRLCILPTRIVSLELRRLPVIDRLIAEFRNGRAPETIDAFVVQVVETLREAMEHELDLLEADIYTLELDSAGRAGELLVQDRARLADTRQDAIIIHRFVAPQSDAIERLITLAPPWLEDHATLREEATAFRRIAADLDSVRARGAIVAEELRAAQAERQNRSFLLLTAISVVFLPLTFLTGLLGVNLHGIPYATDTFSFPSFSLFLLVVALVSGLIAARLLR
ncbi:MAG: CorA family divalent cation transporter [Pseudomonadota bacterium]